MAKQQHSSKGDPLANIPAIFFQVDFNLERPEDFDTVFNVDFKKTALLKDKLSSYLDQIEYELTEQVSTRSDEFFEALTQLESTLDEVFHTVTHIHGMRVGLRDVRPSTCLASV